MALAGIRVIEMAGLAPGPFCGMILADFGAKVVRVDKIGGMNPDRLARGKRSIALNLKHPEGISIVKKLCTNADVLIEPFRAGVMEKLGLGPKVLLKDNPGLVYARMTGYGQNGALSVRAGHDINYLAIAGVLSRLGRAQEKPLFPINLLGDFAGGGMTCALGIMMALFERSRTGQGQVVDSAMVEGAAYVSSFMWASRGMPHWSEERGRGWLDSGSHFYNTYETADGKYMAVGAIEPQFYNALLEGLGLTHDEAPQFGDFDTLKELLTKKFASKTQEEWCKVFDTVDACVTPILPYDQAPDYPHNLDRDAFGIDENGGHMPRPAPKLSRSPAGGVHESQPTPGQHSRDILLEAGFSSTEIEEMMKSGATEQAHISKL